MEEAKEVFVGAEVALLGEGLNRRRKVICS